MTDPEEEYGLELNLRRVLGFAGVAVAHGISGAFGKNPPDVLFDAAADDEEMVGMLREIHAAQIRQEQATNPRPGG